MKWKWNEYIECEKPNNKCIEPLETNILNGQHLLTDYSVTKCFDTFKTDTALTKA
jgi:hypothetical protein